MSSIIWLILILGMSACIVGLDHSVQVWRDDRRFRRHHLEFYDWDDCPGCGAAWYVNGSSMMMDHASDCAYLAWMDKEEV